MQKAKLKISKKLWTVDCGLWTNSAFTLLEILVVLVVLGFLLALVAPRFAGFTEEAAITITLSEMDSIAEAIRDRFYPDLGLIPEDVANPQWALRFLLLKDDGVGAGGVKRPERQEMYDFLAARGRADLIDWDRYSRRGWRGPYLEQEIVVHDDKGTLYLGDDEWHPLLTDAWDRKYRLIYDELDTPLGITSERERLSARLVSLGANGRDDGGTTTPLPLPADTGDDLVMFIFGTGPVRRPERN